MPKQVLLNCEDKMNKSIESFTKTLSGIRTGKANPAVLNSVQVSYYGMMTPISQMAQISVGDPQTIVIKPYDKSIIRDMEKAILVADLGLNPNNDGDLIRVHIPPLTEQTRKELVKQAKKSSEEAKVNIRNIRRDAIDQLKKLEKDSLISEDELKRHSDDVQKKTDKAIQKIETLTSDKEKAIMSI